MGVGRKSEMKTVEELRAYYRNLRATAVREFKTTTAEFDRMARGYAHEAADGEETEPRHYIMGAQEAIYHLSGACGGCR
jgi:hypothetical protein